MARYRTRGLAGLCCAIAAAGVLGGCGQTGQPPPTRHLAGTIVVGDKPLVHAPQEIIRITLIPLDQAGAVPLSAIYDPAEAGFDIVAPVDRFPSGQYKIALTRQASDKKGFYDGAFAESRTPLRIAISAELSQAVLVDLSKREARPGRIP